MKNHICSLFRFGEARETQSEITHNERLEFLGDAVVEFVTSIHLFHLFPDLEEGGLATYRAAIVQNQHLAILAQVNQGIPRLGFLRFSHRLLMLNAVTT
jgi:ribonuclease-3